MEKKEKIKLIIGTVAIFTILFGALFVLSEKDFKQTSPPINQPEVAQETKKEIPRVVTTQKETKKNQATLEINGVAHKTGIEQNTSVYDFMSKLRDEKKINFTDKTYIGLGKFIDEINNIRGDGSRFWIYYVNGKKANIGISNYKINPGDVVSGKYEKEIN